MLYNVFIYESASGLLTWDCNFDLANKQQLEMFGSFFSAIKSFIREMVLKGTNGGDLKNIEVGTHLILIFAIKDLGVDLVFIGDLADEKNIKKVTPKIIEILYAHKDLFQKPFDGEISRFSALTQPMLEALAKQKGLIDQAKSLLEDHDAVIRHLFAKRGKLDPSDEMTLRAELSRLQNQLAGTQNLLVKHRILDQVMQLEQRLADGEQFLATSQVERQLVQEIEDLHYKLNFWLKETKEHLQKALDSIAHTQKALQEADYKHVFRNLMDFAANIKKVTDEQVATRFRVLARYFIDKDRVPPEVLSQSIREVINLKDDALEIARDFLSAPQCGVAR